MQTPTFANIDGTDYSIHQFVVNGSGDGLTTMQILDPDGGVLKMAYWYNDGGSPEYPAGWWDADGAELVNHELKPGEGVIINNSSESGITVQSAGQVPGSIEHEVSVFQIIGNGSPVALLNHKMTITGSGDGLTTMQVLDDEGGVDKMLYWYNDGGSPEYPAGWWDGDGVELIDVPLAPGDAVILNNSSETGVMVTIPGALDE